MALASLLKESLGLSGGDGGYLTGSGQWHSAMTYTDDLVGSVSDFASAYGLMFPDHQFTYDSVASYMIPYVYMKALQKAFRDSEFNATAPLESSDAYERFRLALGRLIEPSTLFGPIEFDKYQRNVGRSPAAVQYLPGELGVQISRCVAPTEVSDAVLVYPSPRTEECAEGQIRLVNSSGSCWLCKACVSCPNVTLGACDAQTMTRAISYGTDDTALACNLREDLPQNVKCDYVPNGNIPATTIGIIGGILGLLQGALLVIVVANRRVAVIAKAQPIFCYLIIVGCMFANSVVCVGARRT